MHVPVEQLALLLFILNERMQTREVIHAESAFGRKHSCAVHYRYYRYDSLERCVGTHSFIHKNLNWDATNKTCTQYN